jgi:hypothetical protein
LGRDRRRYQNVVYCDMAFYCEKGQEEVVYISEDIHNVLNCQNVAKHTEVYFGKLWFYSSFL